MAEILNISPKTISRWETGEGYPEISILKPLAEALGVSVDELLSDEDSDGDKTEKETAKRYTYKHRDIPVNWKRFYSSDFFSSLTIFNKICWICFLCVIFTVIIVSMFVIFFNIVLEGDLGGLPILWVSLIGMVCSTAPKIGLAAGVIGLIAGVLDVYERQIKTSLILCLIHIIIPWLTPYFLMIIM